MFHLRSIVIAAVIGFTIIIRPCQSFFKQLSTFVSPLRPLNQLDSRQDVVVKSWSRKDAESSEFPKDQSVRKLLDMLNSRSISSREAKRSFESILSNWQDFHLSEIGWHRLLDGAIRWRYPSYAISSFEIMTEQGIVCPAYLMTSLLQLICISGFQDVALSLFDSGVAAGLEPSVHCFSPLLKSCGTAQKARELLQRMEFVGIQANVISYTAAIKSCENTGDWRSALELLDLMRASGVNANEITYCCAINVASRGNAGDIAVNILREMLSLGFPPNLLCYGSALTGCAKVGMWHEVEILLEEMEAFGIPLQESVVISVLNVCRGQGGTPKTLDSNSSSSSSSSSNILKSDSLSLGGNDMRTKVTSCQWAKTMWLIENFGLKATNVTESMYTMAMDVCESGGRYREVVATYHLMIAHKIQPSKSSFSFALRACNFLKDGEQAVRVIRGAQLAGAATPFMYNSTLALLDGMKRNDMALKVLRDILAIGALPDNTTSPASPMNSSYAQHGEEEDHYQGQSSSNHIPTSRMRLPPGWLTRRIISAALQNLTENFAVYFTDVKNGRLTPNKELRPFVNEVAEVLKGTVHDRNLYLSTSAYPMANKILLDCGDFETLQTLLNHTLYKPEVNTTRLYDFALKSLLKDSPTQQGVDVILLFLGDIIKATIPQYASSLLLAAMERLALSKIKSSTSSPSEYPLPLLSNSDDMVPRRGVDMNEVFRAQLLHRLFEGGRKLLGTGLPKRAYVILALAYKKADLPVLMVNLYKVALEDNIDDRMLKNIIVFTLARSSEHWDMAIEILEDIRKLNGGVSDINMYYTAFTACDSGRDWEQALYLLNRMREEGHPMTTIAVTSVITACSACGQADEALRLLQMMEDKGIERTVWTYNAAISACAKKGNWRGALSVFEKMRENSMIDVASNGPSVLQSSLSSGGVVGPDDVSVKGTSNADSKIIESSALDVEDDEEDEDEEEEEEEEEDEVEEEGWDERLNPNFDVSLGTGDYETSEENVEGVEEVGLFNGMRGMANQVTYNTLIEALGEGGQVVLVDELYREAVDNNIVSPLSNFKKGWIDLHGHSVHMAKAAIRYAFEYLLTLEPSDINTDSERKPLIAESVDSMSSIPSGELPYTSSSINSTNSKKAGKKRELAVIVGKGRKLVPVIQKLLLEEFHPSVRSSVSKTNSGRLLLCEGDISKWLSIHKSLR